MASIWVYGVGEDGIQAFTDFGIENLIELIQMYKENPRCSSAGRQNNPTSTRPTPMQDPTVGALHRSSGSPAPTADCRCIDYHPAWFVVIE